MCSTERMANQTFLYLYGGDEQLSVLTKKLEAKGFAVSPAKRMTGGIHVRVRENTEDEATVETLRASLAPDVRQGPGAAPSMSLKDYRAGHP